MSKQLPVAAGAPRIRGAIWITALLALLILTWANWRHPYVRFSVPLLNLIWWQVALSTPILAVWIAATRFGGATRIAVIVVLAPVGCVSVPLALLGTIGIPDVIRSGQLPYMKKIDHVLVGRQSVVAYQTNGGATTDYGIVIWGERPLAPGIIRVQPMYSEYHAYDVKLGMNDGRVTTLISRDGVDRQGPELILPD